MTAEHFTHDRVLERTVAAVTTAVAALAQFDDLDALDLDVDEYGTIWLRLDNARRDLDMIVNDWANATGHRLADIDYDRRVGYTLPNGEIIRHEQSSTERWQGAQLLRDLGHTMIDPDTGEQIPAIPVAVLEQIVPGVATDRQTSSKWRTTGLSNLGVDPDDYRSREWKPPRAQRGARR